MAAKKDVIAVFPGTFDPITLGHIDLIIRATKIVDKLIVGVAESTHKNSTMFDTEERVQMVKDAITEKCSVKEVAKIEVHSFNSLLMEFAVNQDADLIIRGLRNTADFDFEFQLAGINSYLSRNIEHMFLMARDKHQFICSNFIKQVAKYDGDVSHFVTDNVVASLREKYKNQ